MSRKMVLILLGGALSSFFVGQNLLAYDQFTTHPALTNEAVNFYNLNFPKNKISEKERQFLIKGAINEDELPRPMNHFYDPVHNRGWLGYTSSKVWGRSAAAQQQARSLMALSSVFQKTVDDWQTDFSYERCLLDYAKGNHDRAFEAFGHVLHLLEDANVPEHTRNDTHIDVGHHTGSPYEHEMAKWNPNNFHIASKLFQNGERPIFLNNLDDYFDEIAKYSNGYFFSEDTIDSSKFPGPKVIKFKPFILPNNKSAFVGIGLGKNGEEINLVFTGGTKVKRNVIESKDSTLANEEIGTQILDGYWSRLSKDFVLHGAGALKMFLEQGEEVKKEYERELAAKKENKGLFGNIFGDKKTGIGLVKNILAEVEGTSARLDLESLKRSNLAEAEIQPSSSPKVESQTKNDPQVLAQTPIPVPTTPVFSFAIPSPTPTPKTEVLKDSSPLTLPSTSTTTLPVIENRGGGSDIVSKPESTPTPSSTPTPTLIPTPTPTPSATPEPEITTLKKVIINEIAWMGTASSSNDEWMELYNPSSKSVDLTGWTLKAQDGAPNIALSPIAIGPFGFYLLERTSDHTISNIMANQIYTGALGNSGEILELRDASNNLQDIVSKPTAGGWYAGSNGSISSPSKYSMERIDPKTRGDSSSNWGNNNGIIKNGLDAGKGAINGTPKAKNSLYVTQKPAKVADLALSGLTNLNSIFLTWTAPADPDTASASLSYDLRYATKSFEITDDWNNAKVALQGSTLQVDNFVIQNFNKTYFFAVKAKDSDGNYSDFSNQVSYTISSAISSTGWPMSGFNQTHTLKTSFLGPANATATTKWGLQSLSSPPTNYSQPVIAPNGNIYFGTSNGTVAQLMAIAPSNAEMWHYSVTGGATIGTPAVMADNSILFGYSSNGTNLTKLDSSGASKFEDNLGTISAVTISKDGTSYFTSSADKIVAVSLDGTEKWRTYQNGISGLTPALLDDGKVYVTAKVSGVPTIYAFDAQNGSLLWTKTMSTNSSDCCGVTDLSYDANNNFLYAGADQYILKIDRSGNTLEQFYADRLVGWGYTTTMISQDADNLIFGLDFSIGNPASQSAVYAVNKTTKTLAWKYEVGTKVNKQIALDSGGNSYFSTKNGWVYSLNQNGVLNWKINLNSTTSAYPVIGPGVLYITLDGGRLVKIGE